MHIPTLPGALCSLCALLLTAPVQAQQLRRTMEPPAASAERDAQLATPAPPSWGPSLTPTPASEPDAAKAKQPSRADPALDERKGEPKADARPADPGARAPRPKRRAVEQVLTPTPRILGSAAPAAGKPVLTYGAPPQLPATAVLPQRGTVPATCSGAGCFDAGGQRLNQGVGNTVTTPQGQLCTRGVVGVQCF